MPASAARPHEDSIARGIAYGIGAFFMLAIMNFFAKLLTEHHHPIEIAFYRNSIGVILFFICLGATKQLNILKTARPGGHIVRGFIGTFGLFFTFAAFSRMPMAETTVLLFTSSLMLPVLGIFLLHEKIGVYRWSAILIGFMGVLVMAQPTGTVTATGLVLVLIASIFHASAGICLRWLGKTENPLTVTFYFVLSGSLISLPALPFLDGVGQFRPGDAWLIAGVGLSGTLAQFLLTSSFKYAPPAIIAPFNYTGLIWAVMFDFFVWAHVPGAPVFIGGSIVIASNLFIIWRENRLARQRRAEPLASETSERDL